MKYLIMECHMAYAVVLDEDGREVAEFADDVVRSVDHRTGQERTWREWEVELLAGVDVVPRVLAGDGFGQSGAGQVSAAFEPPDEAQSSAAVGGDPGVEAALGAVVQVVVVGGEVVYEGFGGLDVAAAPVGRWLLRSGRDGWPWRGRRRASGRSG